MAEVTDKGLVVFNVDENDVINDLSLQLKVGRLDQSGTFNAITGEVTIGEKVHVKLQSITTADFR